jgi:hypothetical protein
MQTRVSRAVFTRMAVAAVPGRRQGVNSLYGEA